MFLMEKVSPTEIPQHLVACSHGGWQVCDDIFFVLFCCAAALLAHCIAEGGLHLPEAVNCESQLNIS